MSGYKTYSSYKESGLDWVGEIPSSWTTKPAFTLVEDSNLSNALGKETNVLSLSYGRIIRRDVEKNFGLLPESFNTYQIVNKGNIILRLTDLQNDQRSLRVGRATEKGIITSAYSCLRCKPALNDKYAYYLLHSYDTSKAFYGMGGGLRQSMKFSDLKRIPLIAPTLDEQEKIAAFLEYETSKIDALIAKQQRLIELLQEKRQAVISHAVTKGLNPDAPMKDSGVEWLGEVPEHWDTSKVKYHLIKFEGGWSPQCENRLADEDEYGVMKVGCVNGGKFNHLENKALPRDLSPKKEYALRKNDLLISRANTRELVGNAAVVDKDYPHLLLCDKLYRLRFSSEIEPDFVSHFLGSELTREQIELEATGASQSMQNISQDTIKELSLPLPPLDEMNKIIAWIKIQHKKLDELVDKALNTVDLLQERRTALISAAVTGKIDVRDWQPPTETLEGGGAARG